MALLTLKLLLLACRLHLPLLAPLLSMHVSVLCYRGHRDFLTLHNLRKVEETRLRQAASKIRPAMLVVEEMLS